jgi:hypothetical protein
MTAGSREEREPRIGGMIGGGFWGLPRYLSRGEGRGFLEAAGSGSGGREGTADFRGFARIGG